MTDTANPAAPANNPASAADPANPAQNPAPQGAPQGEPQPAPVPTFEKTGDARLDLAMEFFVGAGLSEDSPEMKLIAESGNFEALKAYLARSGKAGWEGYVALAEAGYADHLKSEGEAQAAREKVIFDAAGGEEAFAELASWVGQNADADEKTAIKAAFGAGGMQAVAMVHFLNHQRLGSPGVSVQGAAGASDSAPHSVQETPKGSYNEQLRALRAKLGNVQLDGHPEYLALRKRFGG